MRKENLFLIAFSIICFVAFIFPCWKVILIYGQVVGTMQNQAREIHRMELLLKNAHAREKEQEELIQEMRNLQIPKEPIKQSQRPEIPNSPTRGSSSRSGTEPLPFKATAYDLSVECCGKPIGSKGYGITYNGTNLIGKSREQAMSVAVDPKVIKIGTKIRVTFPKEYAHFNGIYTANDKGGGVKGNHIDIFMGDFNNEEAHESVWEFGIRKVMVEILDRD